MSGFQRIAIRVLLATLLAVALVTGLGAPPTKAGGGGGGGGGGRAAIPRFTITAQEFSFAAPDTLPAGLVAFTLRNQGAQAHNMTFLRLNPGVTLSELMAVGERIESGDQAAAAEFLQLVTGVGGWFGIEPGQRQDIVLNLAEGDYILIDFEAEGMIHPFQVVGPATRAAAPAADGQVLLEDFAFDFPSTISAGGTVLRITNVGVEPHEMVLFRIAEGYTLDDVLTHLDDPEPPSFITLVGGLPFIAPGVSTWVTLDLGPGNYGAICFVPNPDTGAPHAALGMIAGFTVE